MTYAGPASGDNSALFNQPQHKATFRKWETIAGREPTPAEKLRLTAPEQRALVNAEFERKQAWFEQQWEGLYGEGRSSCGPSIIYLVGAILFILALASLFIPGSPSYVLGDKKSKKNSDSEGQEDSEAENAFAISSNQLWGAYKMLGGGASVPAMGGRGTPVRSMRITTPGSGIC